LTIISRDLTMKLSIPIVLVLSGVALAAEPNVEERDFIDTAVSGASSVFNVATSDIASGLNVATSVVGGAFGTATSEVPRCPECG
jgi:hypothetical protein